MNFNFDAFISTLPIMGKGMLGIFIVTGIIIVSIKLLNKIKYNNQHNDKN